ncbi:ComEC/Rec2 family competence protein [Coralliovum pocilloporae]|uniref:ComEC/Rec2 family competence protein n=1 Tax=Coralliovum pocilloporae TaxID=3066369 RepID=UPI0033078F19
MAEIRENKTGKDEEEARSDHHATDRSYLFETPDVRTTFGETLRYFSTRLADEFRGDLERGRLFLWTPFLIGTGILLYFSAPHEPNAIVIGCLLVLAVCALIGGINRTGLGRFLPLSGLVFVGFAIATLQTARIGTEFIDRERSVTVTGFVEWAEFRPVGQRFLLRVDPSQSSPGLPARVQVSARSVDQGMLMSGTVITGRARLLPPSGPAIPGGYDFRRAAFFDGKGAIGYFYGKPDFGESDMSWPLASHVRATLSDIRQSLALRIMESLPGRNGALAVALVTGDRGLIPNDTVEALRASGLAHVLAISGMHMAIVAGAVYWLLRAIFAAFPYLALHHPIRKWAATGALLSAVIYLALSGAGVATQRAFIMTAIFLTAVLFDRSALTLRNLALAALCVLLIAPESLLSPGFQMSFAAAASLIAVFERLTWSRDSNGHASLVMEQPGRFAAALRTLIRWFGALILSSLVAGLATGIFAAYHFNRVAEFGLIANSLAMPVVTFILMPVLLLGVLLIPFGYDSLAFSVVGWSLDAVVGIANWVDQLSDFGGIGQFPAATPVLAGLGLGWLCIWSNRWRWLGFAVLLIAVSIKPLHRQPDILVAESGAQVVYRLSSGQYQLVQTRRNTFTAELWAQALADPDLLSSTKNDSDALSCDDQGCVLRAAHVLSVAKSPEAAHWDCHSADIVISRFPLPETCKADLAIDGQRLREQGTLAVYLSEVIENPTANINQGNSRNDFYVVPAASNHNRPWSRNRQKAASSQLGQSKLR